MVKIKTVLITPILFLIIVSVSISNERSDSNLVCTSINEDIISTDIWFLNTKNNTIEKSNAYSDETLGQFKITKSDDKSLIWEKITLEYRVTYVLDKKTMRQSITFLAINKKNKMTLKERSFSACKLNSF